MAELIYVPRNSVGSAKPKLKLVKKDAFLNESKEAWGRWGDDERGALNRSRSCHKRRERGMPLAF